MTSTEAASPHTPSPPGVPPSDTLPAPLQALACKTPSLARVIQFGWRLTERWNFDRCPIVAAALAFFGLMSLFPILLVALAILGSRLAHNPAQLQEFVGFIHNFFPGASGTLLVGRVHDQVRVLATPGGRAIGILSFVSLLWSGRAYFATLAYILNSIWPHARPRTFVQQQLVMGGTMLGAGVLFLLSTGVTFALQLVQSLSGDVPYFGEALHGQPFLWPLLARLASAFMTLLMFWTIYRYLPNAKPGSRGRTALGSALVASLGWEIAKLAFAHFLSNTAHYGAIYGGVGGVVVLLLWLYTSSTVMLLGVEVSAAYLETKAAALGSEKPTLDRPGDAGRSLPHHGPAAAPAVELKPKDATAPATE